MRLDRLHIRSRFKNLYDFRINFDEASEMTVLVGRNGTASPICLKHSRSSSGSWTSGSVRAFHTNFITSVADARSLLTPTLNGGRSTGMS